MTLALTGAQFAGNASGSSGGGLFAISAATLTASNFVSNTANNAGGGLFATNVITLTGKQQ